MAGRTARWIFDALPPSGARRGGDPSEHAFRHDLATLVREVVQNANDQAVGWPAIRFRFIELSGNRLVAFRRAIAWDTLALHLNGAAETKGGQSIEEAHTALEQEDRLLLLNVEDRNTEGLTGAESDGESHFRALCKDTLYSHKSSEAAGGSYGLGKSVLWAFSGLSTVLFNSVLLAHQNGQVSPRLIGRAELPSHEICEAGQPKWFTGSGWFGQPARIDGGALRAESLWGDGASSRADALHLGREDRHGTSILIVGFRDPTSEQIDEVPQLVRRIRRAATKFFWPAMVMDTRHLRLSVGDEHGQEVIAVDADREVTPFVDCYLHRDDAAESLERPGDVAIRRIPVELPRRRDGALVESGHVDLVVRLAGATRRDPLLNHVALFRGPGMVVRYWDRNSLATGIRPFHAILVCGTARNPRRPSTADQEIERFLRAAEPPGHDDWLATPRLKQSYQRGYAKALKTLKDRVSAELRKLIISKPTQGEKGPERLQRRFPIGARGGGGGEQSAFRFAGLQAHFDGSRWHVAGQIELVQRGLPWHARLSLSELGDDGRPVDPIAVESLAVECDDAQVDLDDGAAIIHATPTTRRLDFHGSSVAYLETDPFPGELGVEITSEITEGAG